MESKLRALVQLKHRSVYLQEGMELGNITYTDVLGAKHICEAGILRCIRGTTRKLDTVPSHCTSSSYLQDYITITGFVIDTSKVYDMDFLYIPTANLIDIESIDGSTSVESAVDNIFEKHDNMEEESNNMYHLYTNSKNLAVTHILEDISKTLDFEKMTITCARETAVIKGEDPDFKTAYALINKHAPKSNLEPTVEIQIDITYKTYE